MKILDIITESYSDDNQYIDAVKSQNTTRLRIIVDAAAKAAGFKYRGWHGTPDGRFLQSEFQFKNRFGKQGVHWFSIDRGTAASYADDRRAWDYQNADPKILECYLKLDNPLVVDGNGQQWRDAQRRGKTSDVIEQALESKHDGVIINNVKDFYQDNSKVKATTTIAVFVSSHIKSTELVTHDGSGQIIPLSKRFNDSVADIRY